MNPSTTRRSVTLLFNPFVYIAGGRALFLGLAAMLVAGLIGALGRTHFDGVLDVHVGAPAPLWFFLAEGIVDWLCITVVLLLGGKLISKTAFRVIDVLGTQALARWPTILLGLVTLPPGFRRFLHDLVSHLTNPGATLSFHVVDAAIFFLVVIATILLTAWLVFLLYQAFSVSCNVKGGKAVGTFIIALIVAEILSKFAVYGLAILL